MSKALSRHWLIIGGVIVTAACSAEAPVNPPPTGSGGSSGGGNAPGTGGGVVAGNSGTTPGFGGTPGTGGTTPGVGGTPGTGGTPPGTGGTPPGTGGTPPGTGGTPPGTGGTPPGTGGTASTCTSTGTWAGVEAGGYVTAGTWHGYGFTAKGGTATISPATFGTVAAGQALCACGNVPASADFSGTAMIGINLNQMMGATAFESVAPSGTGIGVTVTSAVAAPMRIQIQGPLGETNEAQRWCADLPAGGGTLAWTDFAYHCWGDAMTAPFNGTEPIAAVLVMVPGSDTAAIPFDFCITGLTGG